MNILGSILKRAIELRSKIPTLSDINSGDAYKLQKRTLKKLLRRANETAFGEHYNFWEILKSKNIVREFQEKVPVHDYNSQYKQWWYRTLTGES